MPANTESPQKAPYRFDPYKTYRFLIKLDGRYVAGVSKMSGLERTTEVVVAHRAGSDPSTSRPTPGKTKYEAITLERGVTYDVDFEQWANKVWDPHNTAINGQKGDAANQETSLQDFRKDILIEAYNEAGQKVAAYNIHRCWPSEFQGVPDSDANGKAVAIEHIKLEHEGWESDTSVQMPDPSS